MKWIFVNVWKDLAMSCIMNIQKDLGDPLQHYTVMYLWFNKTTVYPKVIVTCLIVRGQNRTFPWCDLCQRGEGPTLMRENALVFSYGRPMVSGKNMIRLGEMGSSLFIPAFRKSILAQSTKQ